MISSHPRIAIIGGGPAGLAVGVLLLKRHIPFTIFELRQKPTEEEFAKPSGMLDLHEESGIATIRECGLYDEFIKLTGECAERQKVSDKDGNIVYSDEGEGSERPEISRHALTKLLLSQLPAEYIRWGHKLLSASKPSTTNASEIELDFGINGKKTFNLVIGADGAWSKVRALLTDVKPHYSGTQSLFVTIRHATKKYPHLTELVGRGSFSALANRHGVMSQRGTQDSARIYVFLTTNDENFAVTARLEGKPIADVGEYILNDPQLLGSWGPTMKDLVTVACVEEAKDNPRSAGEIRPLYTLPIGTSWEHKTGATLIGDAAHLMCPWAGEGVNLAMWDSQLLAHAIIKAYETTAGKDVVSFQKALDPLIREFEVDMVARAKEKAEETQANGKMLFGEDGAQAFRNFFLSFRPPPN